MSHQDPRPHLQGFPSSEAADPMMAQVSSMPPASSPGPLPSGFSPAPVAMPPQIHVYTIEQHQPRIVVPGGPPAARQPSAPAPSGLPKYASNGSPPKEWRTLAEQEKDDYYARSDNVVTQAPSRGVQLRDEAPRGANVVVPSYSPPSYSPNHSPVQTSKALPTPILLPPKAAFVNAESPLQSPVSLRQAQLFGDASSIRSGTGLIPGGRGRGGSCANESGIDWSRFSVLVKQSEKEDRSDWLAKETGTSKKWFVIGWMGAILLIVAIVVGIVVGVSHKSTDDGLPKVPNLGMYGSKNVSTPHSTGTLVSSETNRLSSSISTTLALAEEVETTQDVVITTTPTSAATETEEAELETTTSARAAVTTTTRATTTSTTPTRAAATTTTISATTTARAARTTATTETSTPSALSTTSVAAGHHRRYLKAASFHDAWNDIKFTAANLQLDVIAEKRSGKHRLDVVEDPKPVRR
ncbi:hypothetical protein JCM10212_001643 [Sporobolomyces blumeae]